MMRFASCLVILAMITQLFVPAAAAQLRPVQADDEDDDAPAAVGDAEQSDLEKLIPPRALDGPIDPDTYVLGPLDELLVIVHGATTTTHILTVLPEGNIVLPNAGPFMVAGMTLTEFRAEADKQLKRFYPDVDIDIQLSRPRTFVVYVTGEVFRPGPVEVFAPFRVGNAIRGAGDMGGGANRRGIQIREGGEVVRTVDMLALTQLGDTGQNPVLKEGQSVHVPTRTDQVNLIGEFVRQGIYDLLPGETAGDLIDYAGGLNDRGDGSEILLERTLPGQPMTTIMFPLEDAHNVPLENFDALIVRDIRSFDGTDPVELIGGGGRGGVVFIDEPEPLRDFLARLWRFTDEYDTRIAVLEHDAEDKRELTVFNVGDVFAGDSIGGKLVHPGDTVSFPPRDNAVFVTGEVITPGPLAYQPGYTAERYISLAGGTTDGGSYDKLTIIGVDGQKRSGDRNSVIYRGDTIILETRLGKRVSSWLVNLAAVTGLVLSIVALINTTQD